MRSGCLTAISVAMSAWCSLLSTSAPHELFRALIDRGIDTLERPGSEPGARHLADFAVLGRVHVDHHAHVAETRDVGGALIDWRQGDAGLAQEFPGLLGDGGDVRMLDDGPEGFDAGNLPVRDGIILPQFGKEFVGRPAFGVEGGVEQLHSVIGRHGCILWAAPEPSAGLNGRPPLGFSAWVSRGDWFVEPNSSAEARKCSAAVERPD